MNEFAYDPVEPAAPHDPIAGLVPEDQPSRSRSKLLAVGLALALSLVTAGYAALSALSGSAPESAPVAQVPRPVVTKPSLRPSPKALRVPVVYTEQLGRDPFAPLYVVPVAAPVPGATAATAAPVASPGAKYPLKLTGVTPASPSAATTVAFLVSGAPKRVLLNQRFGTHGELLVLSVNTSAAGKVTGVTVQVGDDQPAVIKIGETISVL